MSPLTSLRRRRTCVSSPAASHSKTFLPLSVTSQLPNISSPFITSSSRHAQTSVSSSPHRAETFISPSLRRTPKLLFPLLHCVAPPPQTCVSFSSSHRVQTCLFFTAPKLPPLFSPRRAQTSVSSSSHCTQTFVSSTSPPRPNFHFLFTSSRSNLRKLTFLHYRGTFEFAYLSLSLSLWYVALKNYRLVFTASSSNFSISLSLSSVHRAEGDGDGQTA
jgi:hypothetical protein